MVLVCESVIPVMHDRLESCGEQIVANGCNISFIGDFDGYGFRCHHPASDVRLLDYGHDFYATESWFGLEKQNRAVWIAWANHWAYAGDVPAKDWRGVMSLRGGDTSAFTGWLTPR